MRKGTVMQCNGKEEHIRKKPSLFANKNGFVSIYALVILSVFLLFATMFTQKVATMATIYQRSNANHVDLFILSSLKQHLRNEEEELDVKEEEKMEGEEDENDEIQENSWEETYEHLSLIFLKENLQITVRFLWDTTWKEVKVELNEDKEIMNYEYVQ